MPNSRRRRKHVAASRRQMERYQQERRLEAANKENCLEAGGRERPGAAASGGEDGWLSNVYSWCSSGLSQVCVALPAPPQCSW